MEHYSQKGITCVFILRKIDELLVVNPVSETDQLVEVQHIVGSLSEDHVGENLRPFTNMQKT